MSPRHHEYTGGPLGRIFQFAAGEETAAKSAGLGEQGDQQNPGGSQSSKLTPIDKLPVGQKYSESVLSKKVLDALAEDIDPAKSLADIRRVLVGPTRRLHEARMEEVISILEESDRNAQVSLSTLEKRYNDLTRANESLFTVTEETRQKVQAQADHLGFELQKNVDTQQQMLSEMFLVFDAQLQRVTAELNQRIDELAARIGEENQNMAADLAKRVDDLATSAQADNDQLAGVFEARLTRSETHAEKENRRQIEVFADGFSDIAERLLALRGNPAG